MTIFYTAAVCKKPIPAEPKWVLFSLADNADHSGYVELTDTRIERVAEQMCASPEKVWAIIEELLVTGAILASDGAFNARGTPTICRLNETWLAE